METHVNKSFCKICNVNTTIEVADPNIKYDVCITCYFTDVNNKSNTSSPINKFELYKSE